MPTALVKNSTEPCLHLDLTHSCQTLLQLTAMQAMVGYNHLRQACCTDTGSHASAEDARLSPLDYEAAGALYSLPTFKIN